MGTRKTTPDDIQIESIQDLSVALVRARFNREITSRLLDAARSRLVEEGVPEKQIEEFHVPGVFELPRAVERVLEERPDVDAVLALGAVIRGETPHFDYICSSASQALQDVSRSASVPVLFGVLTCDTIEQARARSGAGPEHKNKGRSSAHALLEMITFEQQL